MERIHRRSREDTYDEVVLREMWQGGADKMKLWVTNVPTSCDRYEIIHHIHPFGWFFGIRIMCTSSADVAAVASTSDFSQWGDKNIFFHGKH